MTLEKQIVDAINLRRSDLMVYYPGPAYDIVNPLKITQGSRFIFVDSWDYHYGTIDELLVRIKQDIRGLGGEIKKFQKVSDNLAVFAFDYENRYREIAYHLKRNVLQFVPLEMSNGYDVYFSKGAGPFHNPFYLARMIRLMRLGGFFVSFDCDLVSHDTFRNCKKYTTPANFDLESLGFREEGVIDRYSLIRKVRHVGNEFEILLPTYFGLVLQEVETFLVELEKNPEWEIGKLIGWRRGIKASVAELHQLAPLMKEKFSPELSLRLAYVSNKVVILDS